MHHFLTLVVMLACGMLAFGALTTLGTATAVQQWVLMQHSRYHEATGEPRRTDEERSWLMSPVSGQH